MRLFDVYPLFNLDITRGQGQFVYDANGVEYLDFYGGHAVISVGHTHPYYVEALNKQISKLVFYSNSVINELQSELAVKLGQISDYTDYSLFLVNSGAEANENALKLSSFHTGRKRIIAFEKAFHGRTSAAVEATDNPNIQAPINRNGNVTFVPFNNTGIFLEEISKGDVAAVIVECIQGVGGIRVIDAEFARTVAEKCREYGSVLICDEVQCGYGRTGKFFAHQWFGVKPDIITTAKGMGNGVPIGGVLISPEFKPRYGMLGTTFGGNHLACAAAIAVLEIIDNEKLVENSLITGQYLMDSLSRIEGIKNLRGLGLMIGFDVENGGSDYRKRLIYDRHLFTGGAGANTVRLLPPMIINNNDCDDCCRRLSDAL